MRCALVEGDWRVNGSRIRIWAQAQGGDQWSDLKNKDPWIVEKTDGDRAYYAPAMETSTYTFSR